MTWQLIAGVLRNWERIMALKSKAEPFLHDPKYRAMALEARDIIEDIFPEVRHARLQRNADELNKVGGYVPTTKKAAPHVERAAKEIAKKIEDFGGVIPG